MKIFSNKISIFCIATIALLASCSPQEWNDHSLRGSLASMPNDWNITASVDNDNFLTLNFTPLTIIDGENIVGVHFSCPEAGVNFVVKDTKTTSWGSDDPVFRSGQYTLFVAPITSAGTGNAREVPFSVINNLLLEKLGPEMLKQNVTLRVSHSDWNTGHNEPVTQGKFYIEKNSIITLEGAFASDGDIILNMDFFQRQNTTSAKFLGESGIYTVVYNSARKFVILSVPEPMIPNYLTLVGVGMGYPTMVTTETLKSQFGDNSDGRGHTYWNYDNAMSYLLMNKVGDGEFQGTVCFQGTNNGYKPYINNNGGTYTPWYVGSYGSDGIKYAEMTGGFTGWPVIVSTDGNDWHTAADTDPYKFFRITVNISKKTCDVQQVTKNGEVIPYVEEPKEPEEPSGPVKSDNFDLATSKMETIDGEMFHTILHTLENGTEYTLKGSLADASIVYNVDFFERVNTSKVKFLGESGDYTLYYNPIRKYMLIGVEEPAFPDYLQATGDGLGYPTKIPETAIGAIMNGKTWYTTSWTDNINIHKSVLFRKISDDVFQATVLMSPDSGFKPFNYVRNGWAFGPEYNTLELTFSGENVINIGPDSDNWKTNNNLLVGQPYRIILDVANKTVNITKFDLP